MKRILSPRKTSSRWGEENRKIHHLKRVGKIHITQEIRLAPSRRTFLKEPTFFRCYIWTPDSWVLSTMKCVPKNWILPTCLRTRMNENEYWVHSLKILFLSIWVVLLCCGLFYPGKSEGKNGFRFLRYLQAFWYCYKKSIYVFETLF